MGALKGNHNKIFSLYLAKKIIIGIIVAFMFDFFFFSMPVLANESVNIDLDQEKIYEVNKDYEHILYFKSAGGQSDSSDDIILEEINDKTADFINHLPKAIDKIVPKPKPALSKTIKAKKTAKAGHVLMTAYNSEKAQTDNSPCTTATGFNVCQHGKEDTIAANFLPFGAKVKIPELFGDRVFVVRDRMNKRYTNKVDIWMTSKTKALQFGVKYAKIEIVP
jgi:3D (Asp-Asp-Asp) domain-containing protein